MDVPSRELRNDTASLLRRVQEGEKITITVRGNPVAQLIAAKVSKKRPLSRKEFAEILKLRQSDPGLRADLARLSGETTDELPIR
ncbi:MAG: type II toxin-antitoxin system prevent-host-death family antitoxin [Actinobacteria bacterium]|nr:type II toxin-antitoxin system prevent-host-death family antitoxin [Actinomycetota bacterium]MCL6105205.1 type II toxin-antitoxin system prevent-host-death family antitoxin [Actinomycetota bacterium]